MKNNDDGYVYDKSVLTNTNTSVLSTVIGHLCVGPFRLVGRVFSNICLLPNKELLRLLTLAVVFNMAVLLSYLLIYFSRIELTFIFSSILVSILFIVIILVLLKREKNRDDKIVGGEPDIDYDSVEEKCNAVPEKLKEVIKQSKL